MYLHKSVSFNGSRPDPPNIVTSIGVKGAHDGLHVELTHVGDKSTTVLII